MKKVFVFCVGGTGLRVMKSIVMMMAGGMNTNGYTVVPILVDPHQDLEEKKNLQSLVDEYHEIHNRTIHDGQQILNPLSGFFSSDIFWVSNLDNNTNDANQNMGVDMSFGSWLGLNNLANDDSNNYLVDTLFSTKNKLNKLSVGFKGNPNVGTVVLGDIIESASWFESFKRHCEKDDRVFIISSIFGGTGASGFPLIEKKVRKSDNTPTVKNSLMGSVLVLPYYGLKDPEATQSDIDSSNFYTKTKAALSYYDAGKIESNYIYYVGEKSLKQFYENNEEEQRDTANFIEVVAASALFDFLKRDMPEQTQYVTRAIEKDTDSLDKESLGKGYNDIIKAVADFSMLTKLSSTLRKESYFPLIKDRGFDSHFYNDADFSALQEFMGKYNQWYGELAQNTRDFVPLNIGAENLSDFVNGVSLDGHDDSYYLLRMIMASNKDKQDNHTNKFRYFLDFAYQAIDFYTNKILK